MKKKVIAVIIAFITLLCCMLCGCSMFHDGRRDKTDFFDKEHLADHLIPDLSQPNLELHSDDGDRIYYYATKEEIKQYVETVFEYLKSCNFEQFGRQGKQLSSLLAPRHEAIPSFDSDLDEFMYEYTAYPESGGEQINEEYVFIWGKVEKSEENEGVQKNHYLRIYYEKNNPKTFAMALCDTFATYTFIEDQSDTDEK